MSVDDVYARLARLEIVLPNPPQPIATFETYASVGNLIFLSGQGPIEADGRLHTGKVGRGVTVAEARAHARLTGINLLAVLHRATGDLNRVARIVKVLGMVNAVPEFGDHPDVVNGCSDLFVDVFGQSGRHARSAVGLASLPNQITVEIEAIVAMKPCWPNAESFHHADWTATGLNRVSEGRRMRDEREGSCDDRCFRDPW